MLYYVMLYHVISFYIMLYDACDVISLYILLSFAEASAVQEKRSSHGLLMSFASSAS